MVAPMIRRAGPRAVREKHAKAMRTQKVMSAHDVSGLEDASRLMMKIQAKNSEKMPIVNLAQLLMAPGDCHTEARRAARSAVR